MNRASAAARPDSSHEKVFASSNVRRAFRASRLRLRARRALRALHVMMGGVLPTTMRAVAVPERPVLSMTRSVGVWAPWRRR